MKKVSVCIVTYNSEKDIISCLEAVTQQTYPSLEIIVVDNASHDNSYEAALKFAQRFDYISVYQNKINNGFAGGQNQAIGLTTGEYVIVLNPDLELKPDFVALTVAALEDNPTAGSASGLLKLKSNPALVDSTGLSMPFNRHAVDRGMGDTVSNWLIAGEIFGPSGAAAVYKREMIEDIKLNGEFFDETFFAYKEDVDVAWRAQLLGWTSIYVPTAVGMHARGWKKGNRKDISLFVRQHSYMNQIFMLIKNEQIDRLFIYRFPYLLFRELVKFGYALIKERDLLKSWSSIIANMPMMMKKRKMIKDKIVSKKKAT